MKNRPNSKLNQLCQVPLLADLLELPELLLQSDLGDLGSRRAGKLYKARSRLYRSQFLQVNTKYSYESTRRDLHNALLCTVLESNPHRSLTSFCDLLCYF